MGTQRLKPKSKNGYSRADYKRARTEKHKRLTKGGRKQARVFRRIVSDAGAVPKPHLKNIERLESGQ